MRSMWCQSQHARPHTPYPPPPKWRVPPSRTRPPPAYPNLPHPSLPLPLLSPSPHNNTGGHSIDSPEPIFGLVVAGAAHPSAIRANSTGRAGDVLLLTKPLGVGAMTTAIKKGLLDEAGYKQVRGGQGVGG